MISKKLFLLCLFSLVGCSTLSRIPYAQIEPNDSIVGKVCQDFYGTGANIRLDDQTSLVVRTHTIDGDLGIAGPLVFTIFPVVLPAFVDGQMLDLVFQSSRTDGSIANLDFNDPRLETSATDFLRPLEINYKRNASIETSFSEPHAPIQEVYFRFLVPNAMLERKKLNFTFGQSRKTVTVTVERKVKFSFFDMHNISQPGKCKPQ